MNIGQLRAVLKVAENQCKTRGEFGVAEALSAFAANLLQEADATTVSAFVSRVEKARKAAAAPARTNRRRRN
jgi:hypothetical protein